MDDRTPYGPLLEDHAADWRCYTSDGIVITHGMRVWDYDWQAGTVSFADGDPTREHWNGWFVVLRDNGGQSLMDGSRLRTRHWQDGRLVPEFTDEWLPAQLAAQANGARHYVQDGDRRREVVHDPRVPTDPAPWRDAQSGRRHASEFVSTELPAINDPTRADGRRYVKPGERVLLVLPASEAACHLKVYDQVWTVLVTETGAQLFDDGMRWSSPITHGEAGIRRDAGGLWIEPLPATLYRVTRDGQPVSPAMISEDAAVEWGMRHQGQSWHYATTHGGYAVQEIDSASLTTDQPGGTVHTITLNDGRVVAVDPSGRLDVQDEGGHYTIMLPTATELAEGDGVVPVDFTADPDA